MGNYLELKLEWVVSHHVGGKKGFNPGPLEEQPAFLTAGSSLKPWVAIILSSSLTKHYF